MTDRLFADTNVLIYAMDPGEPDKQRAGADVLRSAYAAQRLVVSPQILNECYRILVHKRKLVTIAEARDYLAVFIPVCTAPLNAETHLIACHVEDSHRFSWWDCVAVASALQAGCRFFLTEDLQANRDVNGMVVLDPFAPAASSLFSGN